MAAVYAELLRQVGTSWRPWVQNLHTPICGITLQNLRHMAGVAFRIHDRRMSNQLAIVGFAVLAFCLAASSDYLETHYVCAVNTWTTHKTARASNRVAGLSVLMWATSVISLLTIVQVGLWTLIPEGLGLAVGAKLALRAPLRSATPTADHNT